MSVTEATVLHWFLVNCDYYSICTEPIMIHSSHVLIYNNKMNNFLKQKAWVVFQFCLLQLCGSVLLFTCDYVNYCIYVIERWHFYILMVLNYCRYDSLTFIHCANTLARYLGLISTVDCRNTGAATLDRTMAKLASKSKRSSLPSCQKICKTSRNKWLCPQKYPYLCCTVHVYCVLHVCVYCM